MKSLNCLHQLTLSSNLQFGEKKKNLFFALRIHTPLHRCLCFFLSLSIFHTMAVNKKASFLFLLWFRKIFLIPSLSPPPLYCHPSYFFFPKDTCTLFLSFLPSIVFLGRREREKEKERERERERESPVGYTSLNRQVDRTELDRSLGSTDREKRGE